MKGNREVLTLMDDITQDDLDLQLGNYQCYIHLLESSGLFLDKNINAIIKVKVFEQEKYSKVKKDVGPNSQIFWNDLIYFEKNFESSEELENCLYSIELMNHSSLV